MAESSHLWTAAIGQKQPIGVLYGCGKFFEGKPSLLGLRHAISIDFDNRPIRRRKP
jgi:hypothetical protein